MAEHKHSTEKTSPSPRKRRLLPRILFYLLSLGVTGIVIGSVAALGLFYYYSADLPDSSSLENYQPAGMTRIYSRDGDLIAEYSKERRLFVPFDEIPRKVLNAFIAAEDQNFYSHRGVDPTGILRAVIKNARQLSGDNKELVGGSTITQQVVKNFLLTREKSFERKIKEAILALRITQHYSKDRILELYLNEIYLGMGSYGVAAAAIEFFGEELQELSTEEVALLAAMPKAPSSYDPRRFPKKAKRRRNYVIQRMFEDGYINQAEYERAIAAELDVLEKRNTAQAQAPYFAEEVRRDLVKNYGANTIYTGSYFVKTTVDLPMQRMMDEAFRDALIAYDRRHGYRGAIGHIKKTSDTKKALKKMEEEALLIRDQRLARVSSIQPSRAGIVMLASSDEPIEEAESGELTGLEEGIIPLEEMKWARPLRPSGALGGVPTSVADVLSIGDVVLVAPVESGEENTGSIWSLQQVPEVSGAMVAMDPRTGDVLAMTGGYSFEQSEFNRATQAKRQPGSAFKPFVYMSAMERGFTPSSIVADEPVSISQGPGKPPWQPKNYGGKFLGPTTLRVGLEKSRNVMTVRLAQMLGLPRIVALSKRLGIYDDPPENYSVVLGAYETTVLRIVTAYSMLVNGGLKVEPTMITRVDNRSGKTVYRSDTRACEGCQITDAGYVPRTPPSVTDERERVADPRIAYQMVSLLRGVVERGTATKARVLKFPVGGKTGTTNDSRDAWFVGFTQDLVVGAYIGFDTPKGMGSRETGGKVALPAFVDFMQSYYQDKTPSDFTMPPGILQVRVDRATGVPPLPWDEPRRTIVENFVTGGAIFIPGSEQELVMPVSVPERNEDGFVNYDYANQDYRAAQDRLENGYTPIGQPAGAYSERNDIYTQPDYSTNPQQIAPTPPPSYSTRDVVRDRQPGAQAAQQQYAPIPQAPTTRRPVNPGRKQPPSTWRPSDRTALPPGHPSRVKERRRVGGSRMPESGTGGLY